MKKLIFFLLVSFSCFGQYPTPDGQVMFSDAQWDTIVARLNETSATPNIFNDAGYVEAQALAFNANPGADRYDYVNSGATITESINNSPFPAGIPDVASDNIHHAAIYAAATNNQTMANNVLTQIYNRAIDDDMDPANGTGANNPNATYGVNSRFVVQSFPGHPWAFMPIKVTKWLNSYTLLKAKGMSQLTTAQENRLNGWFLDWNNFFKANANAAMEFHYGTDWLNDNFSFVSQNQTSDTFENPAFANSAGTRNSDYTLSRLQRNTVSNTKLEFIHYVGLYGLLYDNQESIDFTDKYYKFIMKAAVFPDGTHTELDRTSSSDINLGITGYVWINVTSLTAIAMAPVIAKLNGLPSMDGVEGSYLIDYTTSEGIEDVATGYCCSPTGGGPKNLRKLYEGVLKFTQQNYGSTYGWSPTRHAVFSPYTILGQDDNKRAIVNAAQYANLYYNDPVLESVAKQDGGYDTWTTKRAYGTGAASIGSFSSNSGGWGMLLAFDELYGDMDGIYLQSTPVPTNSTGILTSRRRSF